MDVVSLSLPQAWRETPLGKAVAEVWSYAVGVLGVAVALLIRLALDPWLGNAEPFAFFYAAVAFVAWRLGWGPAMLALMLGYLTAHWFFLPPRYALALEDFADIVELMTYFCVTGSIVTLVATLRKANQRAEASAQAALREKGELEVEVRQRKKAEAALARGRDELERTVQERTAKLRETVAELEHFSYSLTHDLRAPLRAMQSFAEMLEEELCVGCLRSPNLDYIRRIQVAARRLDGLITGALNYGKVVSGELPVVPVEVGKLLRGMIETYPNLQRPGAEIGVEFDELLVLGNESALTQVFSNLLGNAVKFVAPGVKPRVRVWAESKGGTTRIWVGDNGIGIPAGGQQRIFDMFARLHGEDEYPGTGMGLAIVRKVLQRIGGAVCLDSEPGHGSRFCVDLPRVTKPD
jgi:signal transduction histidine kinase